MSRWVGEHTPLTRATAKQSAVAIATTQETASHLQNDGGKNYQDDSWTNRHHPKRAFRTQSIGYPT
jgi:hypothetical protein